jgi:4-nitrophenyl phosphatase
MDVRGAILDVDGTVLRGDDALPGAKSGLSALANASVRRVFFSNNPTKPPAAYERRFDRAGIEVAADEVLTAGVSTTRHLAVEHSDDAIYVVGERGLVEQVEAAGLSVVTEPRAADVILVSLDRDFDYDALASVSRALDDDDDVAFLGTDPDLVIPTAEGDVPGSGAIVNAIGGVVGRTPDAYLGKPSALARRLALSRLDVPAERCLVVGDRLDTDIALGADAGMTTALVRTGVTDDADLAEADLTPDYVLDSLADLADLLAAE